MKIYLKICLKKKKDTFQKYALQHGEVRKKWRFLEYNGAEQKKIQAKGAVVIEGPK